MTTRAEALARARANFQPGIDASQAQVNSLTQLVAEREAAVFQLPGVVAAAAQVVTWQRTYDDRVEAAMAAPGVTAPKENRAAAVQALEQRQTNLRARLAAINAYYDELDRRTATDAVVKNPPEESA